MPGPILCIDVYNAISFKKSVTERFGIVIQSALYTNEREEIWVDAL